MENLVLENYINLYMENLIEQKILILENLDCMYRWKISSAYNGKFHVYIDGKIHMENFKNYLDMLIKRSYYIIVASKRHTQSTQGGKIMKYRMDLSRTAREAAEKSGFNFDMVYDFLWKVITENHWSVKIIREKINAMPGKIFIDANNQLFKMPRSAENVSRWNDASADYWEGRILARQEACYD